MSEISESEIKSMTKEQNYMRGYADGKIDGLNMLHQAKEQAYMQGYEDASKNIDI